MQRERENQDGGEKLETSLVFTLNAQFQSGVHGLYLTFHAAK